MKKYLLSATILLLLAGCGKEDYLSSNNSSTYSSSERSSLLANSISRVNSFTRECKLLGLNMLVHEENVSFYNHKYQRWLTVRAGITGTWDGAEIFLDKWYTGLIWKHAQQWTFVPIVNEQQQNPKNGGWTFYISNKVGAGKTRYMGVNHKDPINNVNKEYLGLKVYVYPKYYEFEFIPTEIRKDCWQPRGVIVNTDTGRMVQLKTTVQDADSVVLGEFYNPSKLNSYGNEYLWEAAPR